MVDERALDAAVRRFPALLSVYRERSPSEPEVCLWMVRRYASQIIAEYRYVLREGAA